MSLIEKLSGSRKEFHLVSQLVGYDEIKDWKSIDGCDIQAGFLPSLIFISRI